MKCRDCSCYKDNWCTMVTDSPDHDMERDCAHSCCKIAKRAYVCNAFFEPKGMLNEESLYIWDYECYDNYDEERDDYEINPGWYERIHNWDDYGCVKIQDEVTHWMPLPEPPESEGV